MSLAEAKRALRAEALARRDAAARDHPDPGAVLAGELAQALRDRPGVSLAAFLAMGSEIDPTPALLRVAGGAAWGLPVMAEGRGRPLRFRPWRPGEPLEPGGFGTRVPASGSWMIPDVVVVPLVAFDRRGHRLGYGGGFYDRTLADWAARGHRPLLLGFAWAAQEVEAVPTEATDVPLPLVVTEREAIRAP